ncbi:putative ABC transport system permease protein [Luteibacter sp. UNC138MFCol5.1]|uniref:ABC transporter permease n=1 Tax=Luteibacter sp. UNC138MFCol5.1 TaxID=1502774 RepID=UPI0008D50A81|nr:FtsX-like permease family protein [Luteibacter sp. UNC138MFCol5.1]SEO93950.1 putative ABC transport system permease protein [Luteibacter sp. UNC138MFCol5.1]
MFGYYLDLALHSLGRNRALTALMVAAIALGIGASMTTLTVLHVLSGDPLPGASSTLYAPQLDPRDMQGYQPQAEPPGQVTWIDGMNLLQAKRADQQALMTGGSVAIQPAQSALHPFYEPARYTTADFFSMFRVPFRYGQAWGASEDAASAAVAVISSRLNDRLFGGRDSRGRMIRLYGHPLRIIGVLGDWRPNPHFYDLNVTNYGSHEGVYLPLSTSQDLHLAHLGGADCWGNGGADATPAAPCVWLQFWVQLHTQGQVAAYRQFLVHYSEEQRSLGRFQRPPNTRLRDLMQWLDYRQVVPGDVQLQTWLALGFLLVCLVNTVGLMLAKFLRRAPELGVRRALGASRQALFVQLLVESGVVGLAGGLGGLLLACLGLWMVRRQPADYAPLAHLDGAMLLLTFLLAVGASLLAGVLPAWRASRVSPGLQLKGH